jgi:hypothetical protein
MAISRFLDGAYVVIQKHLAIIKAFLDGICVMMQKMFNNN